MGTITPSAPASSAFMMSDGWFQGTRTKAGVPVAERACSMGSIWSYPITPCCVSMQTQS